jgi:hypothetical protein
VSSCFCVVVWFFYLRPGGRSNSLGTLLIPSSSFDLVIDSRFLRDLTEGCTCLLEVLWKIRARSTFSIMRRQGFILVLNGSEWIRTDLDGLEIFEDLFD